MSPEIFLAILLGISCAHAIYCCIWYERQLTRKYKVMRSLLIEKEENRFRVGLLEMALGECAHLCEKGDIVAAYEIAANSIGSNVLTIKGKELS